MMQSQKRNVRGVALRVAASSAAHTVHRGDQDGRKGLYHINAVDQVTQWEIVAATSQISEAGR